MIDRVYKPMAGERLDRTIDKVLAMVASSGAPVRFEFNDAAVTAIPGQAAEDIRAEVDRQWKANAEAYHASPEGQRAAKEAAERLAKHQADHDRLMQEMETAFQSEAATMDWLDHFSSAADHIEVKGIDFPSVISALEVAGYSRSDATGLPQREYEKPSIMARYIAGQAIDCMNSGLPPHQITHKFVAQYRASLEKTK